MNTFSLNFRFIYKSTLEKILLILLFCFSADLFSQDLEVVFHITEAGNSNLRLEDQVKDSLSAVRLAQEKINQMQSEGYVAASIDSIIRKKQSFHFYVTRGDQFRWIKLETGNVNEAILSKIGYRENLYFKKPFSPPQFSRLMESLLSYYEDHGYPFAEVRLENVQLNEDGISADLSVDKKLLLKIDSILIRGNSRISDKYLHNAIGFKPGDIYNHSLLMQLSTRIAEIPFVRQTKNFEVRYFEDKTKLVLFLEKKQASSFNGIVGATTNEETQKLEFTGDVDLHLINAFNKGENIHFQWRSLAEQSQNLHFDFLYPYLFGTPLGFDFNFELFKKDTSYLNLETIIGLRYFLKSNSYFKIFIQNKSSNLLSKQQYVSENYSTLPSYSDSKVNLYGVEYSIERLDYRYNPTRGFALELNFAFGKKRINKIADLEEKNPAIYKGVQLKSQQYTGKAGIRYFIPISSRNTVMLANKTATIINENLFRNELLRIGGLKTLRGFDEESIFASTFSIMTLEYRFLLERNSFISLFSDAGYYENTGEGEYVKDWPIGIGAGVSFETGAGIFSLNYAIGKQFDNPFYFKSGKIHFGFINFF